MRIILTCGGTGGHINPAIAVADTLKRMDPDTQILFMGADDGMERTLVPKAGYELRCVKISNFQRKLTPAAIWHNLVTSWHIAASLRKADQIIRDFQPDVILGTGGYASYPALRQGIRRGIPTAVHESNAVPGLATRLVAKNVSRILVPFEECRSQYQNPERVTVTGTPVREEFLSTDPQEAKQKLGMTDMPLVVSYWGSLGAREMNKKIADMMAIECREKAFYHIHATGSYGWRWMPEYVREHGVDLAANPHLDMREYIYDMPSLMAAADVIICRAGASTISELTASATPAILVPSPNVTDNHQEKNARILEGRGAAVVIREAECDGQVLYEQTRQLLENPERRAKMAVQQHAMAVPDATEKIIGVLEDLIRRDG
ncbi:MAG: UDP-N-acetylglucosamine--N-acetylmuramyl-(pentapeptide) pyrophosphoryl-undecaprenol N-acetylglucosamine transferase [Oscillospiraceae bacterium]|nr:UDP-N-acetylglucosamine--N-acetylmuramyl-(pentapeptide) pyrophosphoryl-undecaprenol N-acetylglucosamine transferase [Oscillospiraceae bacterium]